MAFTKMNMVITDTGKKEESPKCCQEEDLLWNCSVMSINIAFHIDFIHLLSCKLVEFKHFHNKMEKKEKHKASLML